MHMVIGITKMVFTDYYKKSTKLHASKQKYTAASMSKNIEYKYPHSDLSSE